MLLEQTAARLSAVAPALLPIAADAAVKSLAILAVTAFATFAMRRSSAAARHLVWLLGLASLLALPILSAALPAWHVLPAWAMPTANSAASAASLPSLPRSPPTADPAGTQGPAAGEPSRPIQNTRSADRESDNLSPAPPDRRASPPATRVVPIAPTPAVVSPIRISWQAWVLLGWAAGGSLLLAPVLLGVASLGRLGRRSDRIADADWLALLRELSAQLGLRRDVTLLASRHRTMPMIWGIFRIRLLLPADFADWNTEQRRAVLLHELAHARRNDCLTQLLTHITRAAYWFNPLAWLACRQMQAEREMACDDLVLSHGAKPSTYAEQLLRIAAELPTPRSATAAIAMARPSALEGRLLAILDRRKNRKSVTVATAAAAVVVSLLVTSCVAVLFGTNPKPLGATVIFHVDSTDRVLATPSNPIELDATKAAELASFFPQMGQSNRRAGAWMTGAEIVFRYPDGRSAKVIVSANEHFGHWSQGHGDWEPHGDLAAFLNTLRPPAASPLSEAQAHGTTHSAEAAFGPVHDVMLYDPRSDKPAAVNFDTGKTYALPAGAYLAGYEKWLNASNASVMVLTDSDHRILCAIRGMKINLHRIDSDAWKKLSADQVLALAGKPPYVQHDWFESLTAWPAPASLPALPQTGLFQTPSGTVGLVQIVEADGVTELAGPSGLANPKTPLTLKLRYKTVQMPPASPASIAAGFGPAREIILSAGDYLNLATGTFVKAAIPEYKGLPPAQARQTQLKFFQKNGIDIVADYYPDQKISRLTGIDMALTPVLQNSLERMPATDAQQAVAAAPMRSTVPIDMTDSPAYAFRARDGQVGILEITASAEKQITLRCKLVRSDQPPGQPDTTPASPSASQAADSAALRKLRDTAHSAKLQQIDAQAKYDAALQCIGDPVKLRKIAGPAVVARLDPQGQTLRSELDDMRLQLTILSKTGYGDNSPVVVQTRAMAEELQSRIDASDKEFASAYVRSLLSEKQRADALVQIDSNALKTGTVPTSQSATQPATMNLGPGLSSDALKLDLAKAEADQAKAHADFNAALVLQMDPEKLRKMAGPDVVDRLDPTGVTLRAQDAALQLQISLLQSKGYLNHAPAVVQLLAAQSAIHQQLIATDAEFAKAYLVELGKQMVEAHNRAAQDRVLLEQMFPPKVVWPDTAPAFPINGGSPATVSAGPGTPAEGLTQTLNDGGLSTQPGTQPATRSADATLTVHLLDAGGQPLRHEGVRVQRTSVGYSPMIDRSPYWPDARGTVEIPGLSPGHYRFVMEGWDPEFLDVDVPAGGLTTGVRIARPTARLLDLFFPKVEVVRNDQTHGQYLLHVTVGNGSDQPYTLTDDDLSLWTGQYVIRLPKDGSYAGDVVPARGKGNLELWLKWSTYEKRGIWWKYNGAIDIKGPMGSAGAGLGYYRMIVGNSLSLPIVLPAPPRASAPIAVPATQPAAVLRPDADAPIAPLRHLSRHDLAKIAIATRGTLDAAGSLPHWDGVHIPPSCWKPEITALKPIRIDEDDQSGTMRIVMMSHDGMEEGLLAHRTTSNTLYEPPPGEVDTPLYSPSGRIDEDAGYSFIDLFTFRTAPAATGAAPPSTQPSAAADDAIYAAKLAAANRHFQLVEREYKAGLVEFLEYERAKGDVQILQAEHTGDRIKVAEARLAVATEIFRVVKGEASVGLKTVTQLDDAQGEVEIRQAELDALRGKTAATQPAHAPPDTQPAGAANDAVYAAKLAAANRHLRDVKAQFDTGIASVLDYERAKGDVQILQAEGTGDPLKLAEARLQGAEAFFKVVQARFNRGIASVTDLHDAQAEVKVRQAQLDALAGKSALPTQPAVPATEPAAASNPGAFVDITKLPNADLDRIAHAGSATLDAARRLADFDGTHIPRKCWPPAIAALRPLAVEEQQGNVRIVLAWRDGTLSGLLAVPMTASTIPESGADETVMPLTKGADGFLHAVPAESPAESGGFSGSTTASSLYVFRLKAPTPPTTQSAGAADDTVYAAKLAAANRHFQLVEREYKAGLADAMEYQRAKGDVQILQAEHTGDAIEVAEARLAAAEAIFKLIKAEASAGLANLTQLHDAQGEVEIRQAELDALRGKSGPAPTTQAATVPASSASRSATTAAGGYVDTDSVGWVARITDAQRDEAYGQLPPGRRAIVDRMSADDRKSYLAGRYAVHHRPPVELKYPVDAELLAICDSMFDVLEPRDGLRDRILTYMQSHPQTPFAAELYFDMSQLYGSWSNNKYDKPPALNAALPFFRKAHAIYGEKFSYENETAWVSAAQCAGSIPEMQAHLQWLKKLQRSGGPGDVYPIRDLSQVLRGWPLMLSEREKRDKMRFFVSATIARTISAAEDALRDAEARQSRRQAAETRPAHQ